MKRNAARKRAEKRLAERANPDMYTALLDLLREGWSVSKAIGAAGFGRTLDVYERRERDAEFKTTMDTAKAEGADWYRDRNREIAAGSSPQNLGAVTNGLRMHGALTDKLDVSNPDGTLRPVIVQVIFSQDWRTPERVDPEPPAIECEAKAIDDGDSPRG